MTREKTTVKQKKEPSKLLFSAPIRALRQALGLSQEAAARQIDVALTTWRQWEYGIAQPRSHQLDLIAGLTDNPALRANFWLDIYIGGIKLGGTQNAPMTARESVIIRYVNDLVMAAKELCIAAAEGSTSSEEMLKDAADRLIRAAGDTRRIRESTKSGRIGIKDKI